MKHESSAYIDVAKGIGMYAIVLGHSFASASPVRTFVYLWHVPLFFFISGYLYKDGYSRNLLLLAKRRARSLYWPWVKYGVIYLLLHNLFYRLHLSSHETDKLYSLGTMKHIFIQIVTLAGTEQLLGPFWFIRCLLLVVMAWGIMNRLLNHARVHREALRFGAVCVLFVAGNLMYAHGKYRTPWELDLVLVGMVPYYLGSLFKRYEDAVPMKWEYGTLALAILLLIAGATTVEIVSIYSFMGDVVRSPFFLVLTPLLGIYLLLALSKKLATTTASRFLQYAGRNTIFILATHLLCFKVITLVQIVKYGYPIQRLAAIPVIAGDGWWFAYSLAGFLIPLSMKYCYEALSPRTRQLVSA